MPVSTPNDAYKAQIEDWEIMQDALDGERAVKSKGTTYLPKPDGLVSAEAAVVGLTSNEATVRYLSYKDRAVYPLWVKDSLRTMMGMVARLEPEIVLPERMSDLQSRATSDGFGLQQLFMRVCSAMLTKGRKPLLCDFDDLGAPYIAAYTAEAAIDWRTTGVGGRQDMTLTVLTEERDKDVNDEFSHETETVYRVLDINEGRYRVRLMDESGRVIEEEFPGTQGVSQLRALSFIPLVFAGSTDNNADIDEIPLLSMAKAALKYYQLSADLYHNAHHTSHAQPVVTGMTEDQNLHVTGPNLAWVLPEGATAFYLESSGSGCAINERLMNEQRNAALEAGARVIDTQQQESGDARRARQDDQHSSLHSVVMQAAEAIEQCLRYLAEWMGISAEEVLFRVEPEFSKEAVDAAMLTILHNIVMANSAPRSVLFEALRKAKITDKTDDELEAEIEGGELVDYDA